MCIYLSILFVYIYYNISPIIMFLFFSSEVAFVIHLVQKSEIFSVGYSNFKYFCNFFCKLIIFLNFTI